MDTSAQKKIVVVGAGFAGVRAALDIEKQAKASETTLVSRVPYHEYHADLYEIATTTLSETNGKPPSKTTFKDLKGSIAIPLETIFSRKKVNLVIKEVTGFNFKEKKVQFSDNSEIDYDILILALGSETNYFNIANLEKYSLPLKNINDALNIRDRVDEIFYNKKSGERINIVVGGGGFTGCEFAGELAGFVKDLSQIHSHKKNQVSVSIIEACPTLINGGTKSVQNSSLRRLQMLGIDIKLNSKISEVTKEKILTSDGQEVVYDLLVWTAGVKANNLASNLEGVHVEKSCLVVDKTLRVIPFNDVFAIGDMAYCYDEEKSCPVPATAQTAIHQAKHTAKNVRRFLDGEDLELYKPKMPKFIIPLGGKFAVTELSGIYMEGIEAWWLKRLAALKYFSSVLPTSQALKQWNKGNTFFIEND